MAAQENSFRRMWGPYLALYQVFSLPIPGDYRLYGDSGWDGPDVPSTSNGNVLTTIQFTCSDHFSTKICSSCSCQCAQQTPGDNVCLFTYPRLDWSSHADPILFRQKGDAADSAQKDCQRLFYDCALAIDPSALALTHEVERFTYHASDGSACTNINPSIGSGELYPAALEDLLGYSFQFKPSNLIYVDPTGSSTRLGLKLTALPYGTATDRGHNYNIPVYARYSAAPIRDQSLAWAGRFRDKNPSDPPLSNEELFNYPCFQVPPTLPILCNMTKSNYRNVAEISCNWTKLMSSLSYIKPNESFQINLAVRIGNNTGKFADFDGHPKVLPPMHGYEMWSYSKAMWVLTKYDMYFKNSSEYSFPVCAYEPSTTDMGLAFAMADPNWAAVIAQKSWIPVENSEVCAQTGGRLMDADELMKVFNCDKVEGCGCASGVAGQFRKRSFKLNLSPVC